MADSSFQETNDIVILHSRIESLVERLSRLEAHLETNDSISRIKKELYQKHVYSSKFIHVPSFYYDLDLSERLKLVQGTNTSQLCKSIIFENTECEHFNIDDRTNSRYYCVVVQYDCKYFFNFNLIISILIIIVYFQPNLIVNF